MPQVQAQRHSVQELSRRLLLDRNIVEGDLQLRACNNRELVKHRSALQSGSVPLPAGKLLQREHLHRQGPEAPAEQRCVQRDEEVQ